MVHSRVREPVRQMALSSFQFLVTMSIFYCRVPIHDTHHHTNQRCGWSPECVLPQILNAFCQFHVSFGCRMSAVVAKQWILS